MLKLLFQGAVGISLGIGVLPSAALADIRMEEIQLSGANDGLCNLHSTDHLNAPETGNALWFIEAKGRRIGRLDLNTRLVQKFDLPKVEPVGYTTKTMNIIPGSDADQGPCDLVLADDGNLWFNDQASNSVGFIQTKAPNKIKLIQLPTPKSFPMAMQMGADGNIYVQQTAVDKLARINPRTFAVTEFSLPGKGGAPIGGAGSKRDGAHWVIMLNSSELLKFDYATGQVETYSIPTRNAAPFVVRSYNDGVWFTQYGANSVGHFDPVTKEFSTIPMATPDSFPIGIIKGRDGMLYTELSTTDKIAQIDPVTKRVVAEFPLLTKGGWPDEIKQGPDGAIWVPEFLTGKVARLWLSSFGHDPHPKGQ